MANRFRLIWVKSPYTQEYGHLIMDYPSSDGNTPPSQSQVARSEGYDQVVQQLIYSSSDYIHDFSKNLMYCYDKTNSDAQIFEDLGFHNAIDWNQVQVGDRFYVNRWDANHSYFQVVSLRNTPAFHEKGFDVVGYTKDGEIVYGSTPVKIQTNISGSDPNITFFPWMMNFNDTSSYNITLFSMYSDERFGTIYGGYWIVYQSIAPSTQALGQKFWEGAEIIEPTPYEGGGYSTTGGGDPQKQNWSEDSDNVKEDLMPNEQLYGAISSGLVTVFSPSKSQLKHLADVIWGQGFFNWVQNLVENIADLFISLAMMPFAIEGGDTVEVTWFSYDIGGEVPIGTGIYLTLCPQQFMEFDMGAIALNGTDSRIFASDSALDYSPYSKLGIYLPFIGYQELDIDECRGQVLHLKYRVDILSGTCVALISLRPSSDDPEQSKTIYQFTGNCLTQIPLTSMDAQSMITNAVNLGISITSAGATEAVASAGDAVTAELQNKSKNGISATQAELQNAQHAAQVSSAGGSLASASANAVMGMKPNYKKSGAVGASSSLLSVKQPYLFLTTPRQSMPEGYNRVCGYPSNIYGELGSFTGFTVIEDIRLNGLVATSPEVEEIYQLLKSGVII